MTRNTQGFARITQRRTWTVTYQRSSKGGTLTTVFDVDVLNDLLASMMLKVNINVGRFVTLFGNKTLKEHAHARWINLGNAKAVADGGVCR